MPVMVPFSFSTLTVPEMAKNGKRWRGVDRARLDSAVLAGQLSTFIHLSWVPGALNTRSFSMYARHGEEICGGRMGGFRDVK